MKHLHSCCLAALGALLLSACAPLGGGAAPLPMVMPGAEATASLPDGVRLARPGTPGADVLLLGEYHDNPVHHRLRAHWLDALARSGPFVLAMEQIDTDHQAALDRALGEGRSARDVAAAAKFDADAWGWPLYGPFFEFAVRHKLRIVAINLSRSRANAISRGQPHPMAGAKPSDWSAVDAEALAAEIRRGHCGMLPERAVEPIARAQRARDATMAAAIAKAHADSQLPVVVIAGNGHVRRDRGVPRYLRDSAPGLGLMTVGLLEAPVGTVDGVYDAVVWTAAHEREDPCAEMREHMKKTDLGDRK